MTPHQMICHLSDTLRVMLGERAATHTGNWLSHTLIKAIALHAPLPTPKNLKAPPELDPVCGGSKTTEFRSDLDDLVVLIERCAEYETENWPEHPQFGAMSRWDWGRFHYRHIRHHLQQFGA